ncbi:MAG: N-acetylmuramoyl-L-alanine amidase [Clostridia bacterium]|jgi:N-acetylmuramoyl-L-alanine amidase|nr:N-acetylmuramoyl-L-alanine amidase [Clostridiales bacterium]MDK2985049.1 N-acetylmuramoyl-L-alanine amidase [Clostridia bacterium]
MPKVGIDPGHGGHDPGARGIGALEKDVNLGIALFCKEALERCGVEVIITRTTDKFLTLFERSNLFNAEEVDLAVSIHCNASSSENADYISTYVIEKGYNAEIAATLTQRELVKVTGWPDGGVREANFHMVRETKMPAILSENGFLTNPREEKWLSIPENQKKLGEAHAKGICEYLEIPFKPKEKVIYSDVAPFTKDGRTFLPVRAFVEAFGGRVEWISATQEVICYLNDKKLTMKIGSKEMKIEEV